MTLGKKKFQWIFFISCSHPFEILMSDQVFIIWRKRNHFFKVSDLNILNTSITCGGETEKCIDLYILPPPHKMQKSSDDEETQTPQWQRQLDASCLWDSEKSTVAT